jgi:hypothetical protein
LLPTVGLCVTRLCFGRPPNRGIEAVKFIAMKSPLRIAVLACGCAALWLIPAPPARAVTITFDAADLFRLVDHPGDGLFQHQQETPHQLWYRNSQGEIVNLGVTYANSLVPFYESGDPAVSYANLSALINNPAYGTRTTAFNISLRPYFGTTLAWGQDVVLRDPPADWSVGDAALAATYFSATAPEGWNAVYLWNPFMGPVVQWRTDNPFDLTTNFISPGSGSLLFSLTGDLLRDTDMDGVGDTELGLGDDLRLYLGTPFLATNVDFTQLPGGFLPGTLQYDSVVRAQVTSVPCQPVTAWLLVIGCAALGLFKRISAIA